MSVARRPESASSGQFQASGLRADWTPNTPLPLPRFHLTSQLPQPKNLLFPMPRSRPLRPFAIATNPQGKRNASPGPPSPTYSETTNVSAVNLGEHGPAKIITRSDLKASMQSYEIVSPLSSLFLLLALPLLRSGTKLKRLIYLSSLFHTRTCTTQLLSLALEFMFHLPIRAAHNVPSHRRVRRRHGILRRVRYNQSTAQFVPSISPRVLG